MSIAIALYGAAAYGVFLCTFLYLIGFVQNMVVPKTIDLGFPTNGSGDGLALSITVDVLLLLVFAVQHSAMARPAFKRAWTRWVPAAAERSTYVLLASAALVLIFANWHPIATPVWDFAGTPLGWLLEAVRWTGWTLVLASSYMIDHFELFGLKQAWRALIGRPSISEEFRTPFAYRHVRHPLYLGFLLAFFATPTMTGGHLLFAATMASYIVVGIWFEERDLVAAFGQRYVDYRQQVGMLLPRFGRGAYKAKPLDEQDMHARPSSRRR